MIGILYCRFTIHTIEDLRKELNRRANLTSDQYPRPNSPEEPGTRFTATPGREATAPLIYSPGGYPPFSEEVIDQKKKVAFSVKPVRENNLNLAKNLFMLSGINPGRQF